MAAGESIISPQIRLKQQPPKNQIEASVTKRPTNVHNVIVYDPDFVVREIDQKFSGFRTEQLCVRPFNVIDEHTSGHAICHEPPAG